MNASISYLSKTTVKYWIAHKWFSPIKWGNLFVGLSFPRMRFGKLSRHLISSFMVIWALVLILCPKLVKDQCQYFLSFQNLVKNSVAHKWFSPIKWGNLFAGSSVPRMWLRMLSRHLTSSFMIIWPLVLILCPKLVIDQCQSSIVLLTSDFPL